MIDHRKIALLHVARRDLGLNDDDWRALLSRAAGVASSRDLDADGFAAVMEELDRLGFVSTAKAKNFGAADRARGMASPAALHHIRNEWRSFIGGGKSEAAADKALDKWLLNRFGVGGLRMLDWRGAQKATAALHSMNERKAAQADREREDA